MYSIEGKYRYTDRYMHVHVRTTVGYMAYCTSRKKFHHCGLHKYMRVRTKVVDCRGILIPTGMLLSVVSITACAKEPIMPSKDFFVVISHLLLLRNASRSC